MRKFLIVFALISICFSCDDKTTDISFTETSILESDNAAIELNFPKATGKDDVSEKINNTINSAVATSLALTDEIRDTDLNDAISAFTKEFNIFKNDFPESDHIWEANIEGEVLYQSPELISISVSSYIDTGGAHGNTYIQFLNFNPESGEELSTKDLIEDLEEFKDLVKKHFKSHLEISKAELDLNDSFYGDDFELPESIGFSEEGVIILYNTYEIAAYSFGITEFEIPWKDVSEFINRR